MVTWLLNKIKNYFQLFAVKPMRRSMNFVIAACLYQASA